MLTQPSTSADPTFATKLWLPTGDAAGVSEAEQDFYVERIRSHCSWGQKRGFQTWWDNE